MKKALGLAKFSGDHKGLDAAIVKATNYKPKLPKEKHIRTIFHSLSPSKPRGDVVYCIHGLVKRLSQTNSWVVAWKTLIVIHRALRELDTSVWGEFVNYSRVKGYMFDLSHFNDKSVPHGLDYSFWIHKYALYIEERIQCFAVISYDVATNGSKYYRKFDTGDLMEQLPALQNLLSHLLDCKPKGAAMYNRLIHFSLSIVVAESIKLYVAITIRVVELLDKFFEMQHNDACSALKIYQKSVSQAEKLSDFFETCKNLDFGRGQKYINIKMPPPSFMITMEEYIKETPSYLMLEYDTEVDSEGVNSTKKIPSMDNMLKTDDGFANKSTDPSKENNIVTPPQQAAELMGLYDLLTGASEFDENSIATTNISIESSENVLNFNDDENTSTPVTNWEVALFTEPQSDDRDVITEKDIKEKDDGMEVSILDNSHDEVITSIQQSVTNYTDKVTFNPFDYEDSQHNQFSTVVTPPTMPNAYCALSNMSSLLSTEMVDMPHHHFLQQQNEHSVMNKKSTNPFE